MKINNTDVQPGNFSGDPEENLRIENEILQMKLNAELGGAFVSTEKLSPDLENTFLKNVLEFEHAFANAKQVKIFDFLGRPAFKKSDELDDYEIENEWENICALMKEKSIEVDFSGSYDSRLKYAFITEELFELESDDINIPGLITHYIYEEFHPNHKMDIEARSIDFITGWFNQKIDEDNWELADTFLLGEKISLSKKEAITKITKVFDSYSGFSNATYTIEEVNFELPENRENKVGKGYSKGTLSYDAVLESGEKIQIEGPFILYMKMEYQWWNIFHFKIPGFSWE
ncbi:MAG: hypothetical protein ABIN89_31480 [Chitinophagaceae bacterium]